MHLLAGFKLPLNLPYRILNCTIDAMCSLYVFYIPLSTYKVLHSLLQNCKLNCLQQVDSFIMQTMLKWYLNLIENLIFLFTLLFKATDTVKLRLFCLSVTVLLYYSQQHQKILLNLMSATPDKSLPYLLIKRIIPRF